MKFIFLIPN